MSIAHHPCVFILVLNWNGALDTLECLESVQKINYPNYKVVVADNGSDDDSVAIIRQRFPEIYLLENGKNLGFAEGNNVAIRYALAAGADFVLLLNNDTVVDPNLLSALVDAANQYPNSGILAAKIYYFMTPEEIWFAGGKWNADTCSFKHIGIHETDASASYNQITEIDYACGCALFARAEMITKIGVMYAPYFLTYEETDWCYRARDNGFSCLFVPNAKVWHKISVAFGGAGTPMQVYFYARNILLFAERNFTRREYLRVWKSIYYSIIPRAEFPADIVPGRIQFVKAVWNDWRKRMRNPVKRAELAGVRDYVLRRFGNCPESIRRLNGATKPI